MAATSDEKDRLGDALHLKERAEEDRFFAERDAAALQRLRAAGSGRTASEPEIRELARDRCPRCGERLTSVRHHDITVTECPADHGVWLDQAEFRTLADRERTSWIGRFFHRPRAVD